MMPCMTLTCMGTEERDAIMQAQHRHGHMRGAGSGRPGLVALLFYGWSRSFFPAGTRQGRAGQQLFPCYRLTGRETRKKGKRCVVKTWGSSACLPLLPLYFAPSSSVPALGWLSCGLHACDYMFLTSKAGGTHRYHIRAS